MKTELKNLLSEEKKLYIGHYGSLKQYLFASFVHDEPLEIYRYIKALRKEEYYIKKKKKIRSIWYGRKAGIRGNKLGYFISAGCLGKGVVLYHKGNVIINHRSIIGDGCKFHGDNCVGNNGITNDCPKLGKNVDVGIGAKIIGGVELADNIKIGANAVVTKSFLEPNIVIGGVPAKRIK